MKNKLSQIIFSFIAGASFAVGGTQGNPGVQTPHTVLVDSNPKAHLQKLNPTQLKDIMDLKLEGVDAYVISIENPSRRSYSVCTSSLDSQIIDFDTALKILEKKGSIGTKIGLSAGGMVFWPIGVIGNIYSMFTAKKGKIFEGKMRAMLLNKEVVNSYSQLNRIILVASGVDLNGTKVELIDMQTFKPMTVSMTS